VEDIIFDMLQTNTFKGAAAPATYASYSFGTGAKYGVTVSVAKAGKRNLLIGKLVTRGFALPAGPIPINGAAGLSNTFILEKEIYREKK